MDSFYFNFKTISIKFIFIIAILNSTNCEAPYNFTESQWPNLCKVGQSQSPINLTKNLENCIYTNYTKILSTNYINISNSSIIIDSKQKFIIKTSDMGYIIFLNQNYTYKYILSQIEVKTPTEHTIDGVYGNIELQLVHKKDTSYYNDSNQQFKDVDSNTNYLVISLIFIVLNDQESALLNSISNLKNSFNIINKRDLQDSGIYTNKTIDQSDLMPNTDNNTYEIINLNNYVNPNLMYYYYQGSLTSPNCEENVNWLVLNKFSYFSIQQQSILSNIISPLYPNGNNRRTKPLNGRQIYLLYNNNFQIQQLVSKEYFLLINIYIMLLFSVLI